MKAEDVRDLSDDQLVEKLVALKKEAMNLRFQQASRELENPARMRQVRRDIARVKTAMTARRAAGAQKAEA